MSDTSTIASSRAPDPLAKGIDSATKALLDLQRPDGHWVFELEADATIPAEYVLLRHYRGEEVDSALEAKIATYLRRIQGTHGGWPLFHDGAFDMSASVKAYFALKMIGDPIDAPHMKRARDAILSRGGAARSNVFTRTLLALYGVIPWRAVPMMPVEIMLLPAWFPFHLSKISYWARTVIAPLLVLAGTEAESAQSERRQHRRIVRSAAGRSRPRAQSAAPEMVLVHLLPRGRCRSARGRAVLSRPHAQTRDRQGRRLRDRAAQRRGRPRRDFPGHGQFA